MLCLLGVMDVKDFVEGLVGLFFWKSGGYGLIILIDCKVAGGAFREWRGFS